MATIKDPISIESLLQHGIHFGHQSSRWNPHMKGNIHSKKGNVHIIDLEKTIECMKKAFSFIEELVKDGKTILFVGTKKQARSIVKEQAERCAIPYVNARWLGGTFTNFETIKKSIRRLERLEARKNSDAYNKLTKKEQTLLGKQLDKLLSNLAGIRTMKKLPDAVFVVDTRRDQIAVAEANKKGVPIIAFVDTNSDPRPIAYPIPANDDAIKALQYLISKIVDFILYVREKAPKAVPAPIAVAAPAAPGIKGKTAAAPSGKQ